MKFAFPTLKKGLKAREEKIRTTSSRRLRAEADAEQEAAQYRAQIGDARGEGVRSSRRPAAGATTSDVTSSRGPRPTRPTSGAGRGGHRTGPSGRSPTSRRRSPTCRSVGREGSSSATSTVTPSSSSSSPTSTRSEAPAVESRRVERPERRSDAYADACLAIARAEDQLGAVEDDLFRFARTLEGNDALRIALTDPPLPRERRIAVVDELMAGKALAREHVAARAVIGAGRATTCGDIVDRVRRAGRDRAGHEVAEVRSAIELDDATQVRPAGRRSAQATGKDVEVKVIVDPSVLGGIVARIGDTVIDGSVRHRLDQLKGDLGIRSRTDHQRRRDRSRAAQARRDVHPVARPGAARSGPGGR